MSERLIIQQCSPTLAGLKTGNLFTAPCPSKTELQEDLRKLNQILVPRGLRILPLRYAKKRVLLYLYRPDRLRKDLEDAAAWKLLQGKGYPCGQPEHCLACLRQRLKDEETFPHEIGLFLGYPPEDVQGFIENKAGCCKCAGCWKVYGDVKRAQKTFHQFRNCTRNYCAQWAQGATIEQLTVTG